MKQMEERRAYRLVQGLLLALLVLFVSNEARALSCTEWIYETAGLTQPQDTPLEGATLSIIARDPGSDEVWLQVQNSDGNGTVIILGK